ncbi:MAG: peptidylprolyl isomerase [Succinivibrio sp.]|nr:peptidylprolyl isomerase [Succinivibrio sp.]
MKISRNTVVSLSFTVTDLEGQVLDRTKPGEPMVALIGYDNLIEGLEKALDGHEKGDEFSVVVNPSEAYGEVNESLIQEVDKSMFGDFALEVGQVFEAESTHGPVPVIVKEIKDNTVIVDANHPFAGKALNFLVVIDDVREATEEEKKHGHAHPDGHCPSEEHHHCCHHHDGDGEHHCCHKHDGEGEHHCCHEHDGEGEHHCCHEHDGEGEHHCCHEHDEEHEAH